MAALGKQPDLLILTVGLEAALADSARRYLTNCSTIALGRARSPDVQRRRESCTAPSVGPAPPRMPRPALPLLDEPVHFFAHHLTISASGTFE